LEPLDPLDLEPEPPDDFDLLPELFEPLGEEERLLDGLLFAMVAAIYSMVPSAIHVAVIGTAKINSNKVKIIRLRESTKSRKLRRSKRSSSCGNNS
jgi:hypothetical protein